VTASEFGFLALGLALGVASGAALVEVLRARPPSSHGIRITVAPNSIQARRSATLADDTFADGSSGPAARGPGDRRWTDADPATDDAAAAGRRADDRAGDPAPHGDLEPVMRTPVPSAADARPSDADSRSSMTASDQAAGPVDGFPRPALMWLSPAAASTPTRMVAVPMSLEPDPITHALRATAAKVAGVAMGGGGSRTATASARDDDAATVESTTGGERIAVAAGEPRPAPAAPAAPGGSSAAGPSAAASAPTPVADRAPGGGDPRDGGPCADERRVADERCAVASRARDGAAGAAEALRVAQRAYDAHVGNAETAAAAIDPRSVRSAKETAQRSFRDARAKAATREDVEAAARTWLSEINQINRETREAGVRIDRDRAGATALAPVLERLAVEADAARIAAERADQACVAAREAVAACQEARTLEAAAAAAAPSQAPGEDRIAAAMAALEDEFDLTTPMGSRAGEDAVLIRILGGDHEAMLAAVARLGGDDADARRRWQTWLSALAEALIARSIEASAFDFPLDHFFWGPFSQTTNRDIAAALASIGFRFDGFGGWADERVPGQRDLSMAVGYAGEDPMRIRRWPTEAEMLDLFRDVRVAADEYIASAAGGLTLGELVTLLGRRADALTELWNEWGIARPVLLEAI
jgi:hypothetical protein